MYKTEDLNHRCQYCGETLILIISQYLEDDDPIFSAACLTCKKRSLFDFNIEVAIDDYLKNRECLTIASYFDDIIEHTPASRVVVELTQAPRK